LINSKSNGFVDIRSKYADLENSFQKKIKKPTNNGVPFQ
jgi:hypothetical protein